MANFIDNFNVVTAITDNTKLDLGHQHITTANFMQLNPVLCKEMVPGERVDVNMMTFSRLQPLAVPTFGRANIKERAFFVPFRTIFRGWNDFITDTPHVFSGASSKNVAIISEVPTVSNAAFVLQFLEGIVADQRLMEPVQTIIGADIVLVSDEGIARGYNLTSYGRQWLKILESLGYKIVWDARNEDVYSALPLMAFMKVVMDWYFPSQYVNTGIYVDIMGVLNYDSSSAAVQLHSDILSVFADTCLYVNYDSDYFVSAWDNPAAPTNGVYSSFTIMDATTADGRWLSGSTAAIAKFGVSNDNIGTASGYSNNGTPLSVMAFGASQSATLPVPNRLGMTVSDYQHKSLALLTDYMKRHQLVGARAMDRYLARFGKMLSAEKMNRSNYISSKLVPLQIGDVMSTSNTSETGSTINGLGQFAGKGIAFEKSFSFDWSTNEYGMLLVLSSIVPAAGLPQGLNRHVMHKSKLDFWTPEFDNLGVQAISTRELYNTREYTYDMSGPQNSYMSFNSSVFGFAPRYGEYKYANDQLTGDFTVNSLNQKDANSSAWHTMRMFDRNDFWDGTSYSFSNLVHSRAFVSGLDDHYQYNRIFTYMSQDEAQQPDPFTLIYDFDMVSFAPMKPLYEAYEFDDADSGKKVQTEVNGVKAN